MDIEKLISELTLEEKIALVSGRDFMYTNAVPRLGIPALSFADGPHGLRKQVGESLDNGVSRSEISTAFPTASAIASGFNTENARRMGEAIGEECRYYGVNVLLGPGINIKRNPLGGRCFEYFSEDPLLSGKMGAAEVSGLQSRGVGACLKHFAANNSENYRFMGDSIVDRRALNEIYYKSFEIAVTEGKPYTAMCAYNKINGTPCSESRELLTDVLRERWGFDGLVMTDWGAMRDRVRSIEAGLDLETPGDTAICRKALYDAVKSGELDPCVLDGAVRRVLSLIERCESERTADAHFEEHHRLAGEIAADCAVLLENRGALPLKEGERICIVGEMFEKMRYQGSGSSMINPTSIVTPKDAFDKHGVNYIYSQGYSTQCLGSESELIDDARRKSEGFESVIAFVGLTDYSESEGEDRENMRLPDNQLALIDALINAGKRVCVVLFGGSVCELPFRDNVSGILCMHLPGQNGGSAVYELLYGIRNPSGRLAESWPISYDDVPFGHEYSKGINEVYKESVYVGYRYYVSEGVKAAYPFGYGLSYTEFEYGGVSAADEGDKIRVDVRIRNTGSRYGAEVVQIYTSAPDTCVPMPRRELRAFSKVYLEPGEASDVTLYIEKEQLRYYDIEEQRWVLLGGEYEIQLARDAETVIRVAGVMIDGEKKERSSYPDILKSYTAQRLLSVTDTEFSLMSGLTVPEVKPTLPIHMESRFTDLKSTFVGKMLFNAVLSIAYGSMKKAEKMPEGAERENRIKGARFLARMLESGCLRSMTMSEGRKFPYNFAEGFMHLANGRILKGIACFLSGIKAPPLPK